MTLPLWSVIILALLASWGIYATLKLARRDITIINMQAHITMQEMEIGELEQELAERHLWKGER